MQKPHIQFRINETRNQLTLTVSPKDQKTLAEMRDSEELLQEVCSSNTLWGTSACEAEILEGLLANSELQYVDPSDTGDLTDAPILGILDSEDNKSRVQSGPRGATMIGGDTGGNWYIPILECWGFPNYQIRSFLDDLADKGEATFINAW